MKSVTEIFASKVFNLTTMKTRLPADTYKSLVKTINNGTALDPKVAEIVADAMKDWAIENGCTHYTHWFQPMTGVTAEKHDSFISPTDDGRVIMEFSGKELIIGEPDASSFPSGGLRATFEARGYTAWDPTSYAFIKDKTLCVPTTFFAFSGEVLDNKTPLLRSVEAVNKQSLRVLKHFGCKSQRVVSYVGPEQEYFLTDKSLFNKRKDLLLTGRTLFGAPPAKGQESDDHYFGQIKERVAAFMKEADEELWKLGVFAKTEHNEAAPAQHEIAPIFETANLATDHNQITMEIMKKVASHHGLVCLLHEKPYAGVNGSGKHNNWSLGTTDGINLFKPGKKPLENKMFLLFLCAVIKAVDEYPELIRVSSATAGNDHRLGAAEAPPAIVSIFLGDELTEVLKAIKKGRSSIDNERATLESGVDSQPVIKKDNTDRNRTSPFAFTGNRFEFRMTGSSQSVSGINIILNTVVAEELSQFADILDSADNTAECIDKLIKDTVTNHERVIFNGNGYSKEWEEEAARRGLPNLKTTVDALPEYKSEKAIKLFSKHGVFSPVEVESRYEIMLEDYAKALHIEMQTMLEISQQEIIPAAIKYSNMLSDGILSKKNVGIQVPMQQELLKETNELLENLIGSTKALNDLSKALPEDEYELALCYRDKIIPAMNEVRKFADSLEMVVGKEYWPFPTYTDLLYTI